MRGKKVNCGKKCVYLAFKSYLDSGISIEQMCFQCIPTDMETQKSHENWSTEEDFNEELEILKWRDLPKGIYDSGI